MCKTMRTKDGKVQKGYKFSWIELIVNTKTGETSATGVCGMLLITIPLLLFVVMTVWYFFNMSHSVEIFELMDKLIALIGIGSGLLGLRKISGNFAGGTRLSVGGGNAKKPKASHKPDVEEEIEEEEDPDE